MDRFIDDVFRAPVREAEKIVSMDLRRYRDDHSWSREGRVTRGLGWMGMGVIATVSLGLMAAAPYAVLLGFGLSQQVAMIISLAFAGVGAVASPAWVMGSTLIAHIAQNALARLMNPGLKILGLATIPIWNLDSPLANLTLQEIVERNQLKAKGSFVLFLNKLADLTKRDTEDESLFFFADLESWSYEHPPQVTKALSNLIQIIHKDLIRTFPVYSKLAAKESPGKFLNNAGNILVFWSDHYLLLVSPPKNSNQFNRAHQLIGTTIKSSGSPSLTIDSLIGFGTFGNAYRAIDSNGKPYLVKTSVQPDKITTLAMTLARTSFLLHEGNLLKRLSQRLKAGDKKLTGSFPEFYGFAGTANSTIAFISEFIAGKTLFDLVRDPQGNESLSFSAATELVNSVSSLHQAGFVHRDIKSNNIIIDTKGHPRLIDFGGALQFQDKLEREIPEETLNDDLASFNETNVPDDISIPLTKPGFDYFHLWSLFNKTLPLFKDLDPLLKTNPTDLVGKKNRNLILARDPVMAKVFKIWEEQKVRFFIDVVLRISSSAEKAEATRNWLIDTETLIEKLQTDENANLLNQQKENPPLNNIFVRILMVFFSSSVAEKWGMRLLPVEVGGIIGTGWMASAWGTGLFPGVLLLDPAGVGGLVMVGGLALFKGLHYGLAYIQFGLGRGEKPVLSLSGFANEFSYFLPYVALPFLASNAVLFAAGAAVAAYIHYSYDNKLLSAEKTADAIVEKINTTTDPTERMALNAVVGALMMKGRVSELNLKRVSGGSAYWTQQDLVQTLMEYGDGQAVEALQSSEAKSNALTVLAHLMVQEEGQGPGVRTLLDFMSFNSWEKEVQETAKTMIEGLTKARQPVLLLHDGTGDTNAVLAKLGITLNSTQVDLIDTQEADPGITMTQVVMDYNARTSGKGVPLASTVLVQNDQSILMDLDGFSTQKYSDLTKAIKKALDTMIAVLKSA